MHPRAPSMAYKHQDNKDMMTKSEGQLSMDCIVSHQTSRLRAPLKSHLSRALNVSVTKADAEVVAGRVIRTQELNSYNFHIWLSVNILVLQSSHIGGSQESRVANSQNICEQVFHDFSLMMFTKKDLDRACCQKAYPSGMDGLKLPVSGEGLWVCWESSCVPSVICIHKDGWCKYTR